MKTVAPPTKNTSGAGGPFETEVVAACLLDLLLEQALDGWLASRLEEVSVQKIPARWQCDDIRLIYALDDGEQLLVPTSVKSFPALADTTPRREFVSHAWSDVLSEDRCPRPIRLGHDRIGLFTAPHDPKLAYTLNELIKKAREQNSEFRQNVTSPGHLADAEKWLTWLDCPSELAPNGGVSDGERQAFIASLELRSFDFENLTSQSRKNLVDMCRSATVSESHDHGRQLWGELCRVAEELRHAGGDINRPRLIRKLATAPTLKDAPRFSDSWRRLNAECDCELERQSCAIGRAICLTRKKTVDRILETTVDSECSVSTQMA